MEKGTNKLDTFVQSSSYCKLWCIIIIEFICFLGLLYIFFKQI